MTWERFHFSHIWMAAWSLVSICMAAHRKGFPQTSFWFCRWQTVASSPVHMLPLPWHADSIVLMTAQWQVAILMPPKMANSILIHGRDHKPPKCCTALCLWLLIAYIIPQTIDYAVARALLSFMVWFKVEESYLFPPCFWRNLKVTKDITSWETSCKRPKVIGFVTGPLLRHPLTHQSVDHRNGLTDLWGQNLGMVGPCISMCEN